MKAKTNIADQQSQPATCARCGCAEKGNNGNGDSIWASEPSGRWTEEKVCKSCLTKAERDLLDAVTWLQEIRKKLDQLDLDIGGLDAFLGVRLKLSLRGDLKGWAKC